MHTLAIETSQTGGSFAVLSDDRVLVGETLPRDPRTAQTLIPAVRRALGGLAIEPAQLGLVAVTLGPGSFTGLRLGLTTARAVAYATGAALVGVGSHELLAEQFCRRHDGSAQRFETLVDAHRGELFRQVWSVSDGAATAEQPADLVEIDGWLKLRSPADVAIGPGLLRLADRDAAWSEAADHAISQCSAETLGSVAWQRFQAGHRDDLWGLQPVYGRRSAAEEKALGGDADRASSETRRSQQLTGNSEVTESNADP